MAAIRDNLVRCGNQARQVFVSAGVLCVRPSQRPPSLEKLLNAADKLMYAAKRSGGNRADFRAV